MTLLNHQQSVRYVLRTYFIDSSSRESSMRQNQLNCLLMIKVADSYSIMVLLQECAFTKRTKGRCVEVDDQYPMSCYIVYQATKCQWPRKSVIALDTVALLIASTLDGHRHSTLNIILQVREFQQQLEMDLALALIHHRQHIQEGTALGYNRHQFQEQQVYFKTRFLVHDYEGLINEHYICMNWLCMK